MNKKKNAIMLAVAVVMAIAVVGTIAYLKDTTGPVTNTFAAANLVDTDGFKLVESVANKDENNPGVFELDDELTDEGNEYNGVVPGISVPKDPRVLIKGGKLKQEAYLYIEVVDTLPDSLSWFNTSNWLKLDGATGANGGEILQYKGTVYPNDGDQNFFIIDGNEVEVPAEYDPEIDGEEGDLKFYAYLAQASGFSSADEAWNAVFGSSQP